MLSFFQFGDWSLSVTAALALIWLVARACYILLKKAALVPSIRTANLAVGFGGQMKQWWEAVIGPVLGGDAAADDKRVWLGPAAKSTKAHAGWYATCDCPALWE